MASAAAEWSGSSGSSNGSSITEKRRGEKRRASGVAFASEGRGEKRGRALLLPALMEAARLLQYSDQYRNCSGRAVALRASLRVTCEAYLKLVGASQFTRDSDALRLIRLLTETHVQAQARAMAKSRSRSEPRSMEQRSMVQLAEIMAREYVAEMKGEEVLYTPPVPVEAFRPVKKRCRAVERDAGGGALHGELSRVAGRSAFTSVTPSSAGADSDSSDASLPSVISSSEKCADECADQSDGIVSESDFDEYEDEDEYEVCRADGKNLAQCMCYKCVLGEDEDEE